MKSLGFVLALGLAAFACGDDGNKTIDAPTVMIDGRMIDAPPDGPPPPPTLTSYVIDLVKNHTNSTEAARPFTEFSTLADPDQTSNNVTAYASLFP